MVLRKSATLMIISSCFDSFLGVFVFGFMFFMGTNGLFSCLCCSELTEILSRSLQPPDVKRELLALSIPAIAGQALEPLAQLMETAYIGRLGM